MYVCLLLIAIREAVRAKSFAGVLAQCPVLAHLDLSGNRFGDAGAKRLTESCGGPEGGLFLASAESEELDDVDSAKSEELDVEASELEWEDEEDADEGEDEYDLADMVQRGLQECWRSAQCWRTLI